MKPKQLKTMIETRISDNSYERQKVSELLSSLDESVCEQVAIDISTKCESRYLSLKMLVEFVKNALILNAVFLANKSQIIGVDFISSFEENQKLRAFYFKKALKKLPEWVQKAILGDENE